MSDSVSDYDYYRGLIEKAYSKVLEGKSVEEQNKIIDSELSAILSSKYLFTDESFLKQLSGNEKLSDKIKRFFKELKTKLKGTKYAKDILALQKKYSAMVDEVSVTGANTNEDTQYSFIGEVTVNNLASKNPMFKEWADNLEKAKQLYKKGLSNEEIRKESEGWFHDDTDNWWYEIPDNEIDMKYATWELHNGDVYKLKDFINAKYLNFIYEDFGLGDLPVFVTDNPAIEQDYAAYSNGLPSEGSVNLPRGIYINSNKLGKMNFYSYKGSVIHEIQHFIQEIEGVSERGEDSNNEGITLSSRLVNYILNKGEIAANDVERRMSLGPDKITKTMPMIGREQVAPYDIIELHDLIKANGGKIPEQTKKILKENPLIEKLYDEVYNNDKGDYNRVEFIKKYLGKDLLQDANTENLLQGIGDSGNNKYKNGEIKSKTYQEKIDTDNVSFSLGLKQKQLDILQNSNPMLDDYHTGIRDINDIKTLEETLQDSDWGGYDEFNPDLTRQDIEQAIYTGKIMVYSSYPIENGTFVSPSKMEAQSYSSDGNVYSQEVNINDVAWIDPTQGEYAKVDNQYSLNLDSQGRELSNEQIDYFKDSKVRDENGHLLTMYHGSNSSFTVFDKSKGSSSNSNAGVGFWNCLSK